MTMKLNIGCGGTRKYPFKDLGCEVNCDIKKPDMKIDGFIQCDACNMPFREKIFSEIFSYHLIEHIEFPHLFTEECSRLTDGHIHIITPNFYSKNSFRDETHIHHFKTITLKTLLEKYWDKIEIKGEGGFWIPIRGNRRIFSLIEPISSKFPFLANNLQALARA